MEQFIKNYLQAVCNTQTSPMEVFMKQQEDASVYTILDVRMGPAEFLGEAIIGAKSIPLNELFNEIASIPKDKKVVVYTWGSECTLAKHALLVLLEAGYDTIELGGGIAAWKNANLPTVAIAQ